jgi:hypothetical protein
MARTTPTAAMAPGSPPAVQTAMANVIVNGEDVGNVALAAHAGLTISGQIAFEGQAPAVTLPLSLRVPIPTTMTIANAGFTLPAVQIDGTRFKIEGIIPGPYRLSGNLQGIRSPIGTWWLKSFVVGGRDILDAPLDLQSSADDAVATFTDRVSEVSGVAADGQGTPVEDAFVVVFTTDRAGWFYNSRRIAGVRAGRDGGYSIRNLPPGEYRVLATRDLEQGEWFDPGVLERLLPVAVPVTIAGPEKQVRNLAVR